MATLVTFDSVEATLGPFRTRMRLADILAFAQKALLAAAAASLLLAVADRLGLLSADISVHLRFILAPLLIACLARCLWRPPAAEKAAVVIDSTADLRNLLRTALEAGSHSHEVGASLRTRALDSLGRIPPSLAAPFRRTWHGSAGAGMLLASAVLLAFAPRIDVAAVLGLSKRPSETEKAASAKAAATLSKAAEKAGKLKSLEAPAAKAAVAAAADFKALSEELPNLDKAAALSKIGEFEAKSLSLKDTQGIAPVAAAFPKLFELSESPGLPRDSAREMRKMAEALSKGDLSAAAESMRNLANKLADPSTSAEERKALAEALSKMAKEMSSPGVQGPALSKALSEMQAGECDAGDCQKSAKASQALADSMDAAEAMKEMEKSLAEARQNLSGDQFKGFKATDVERSLELERELASLGLGDGECPNPGMAKRRGPGGGAPPETKTDTGSKSALSPSTASGSAISAQIEVLGKGTRGTAPEELQAAAAAAGVEAAAAMSRDRVPRDCERIVKAYFSNLQGTAGDTGRR